MASNRSSAILRTSASIIANEREGATTRMLSPWESDGGLIGVFDIIRYCQRSDIGRRSGFVKPPPPACD